MRKPSFRHDNSGQIIVITGLLVALLLLSTAIFVIETEKDVPTGSDGSNVFAAYEQSTRATMISALANVTNGGDHSILAADLNQLESALTSNSYQSILQMNYTLLNEAPYQNGFWNWSANGQGVSSAYAIFQLNSSASSASASLAYSVNITSQVNLTGSYSSLGSDATVNLMVNVLNEGKPELAQTLMFTYQDEALPGNWIAANSPSITDFGNGTYAVSFTAALNQPNDPLLVSVLCQDQRGITVGADVTCTD